MQSSPPHSEGKVRALRELSLLSHSPRSIPSLSPPASESNPTQQLDINSSTSNFFDDPDLLMSTQHNLEETNELPQYRGIRSTAKKMSSWQPYRPEVAPNTSMVAKEFRDFDQSMSDEESMSLELARGDDRSNRNTPNKVSSSFQAFNSLYDITPPSTRTRKPFIGEAGSLRRDAQIRRASRNEAETASPRVASTRNSPANQERKRTSLAQMHAKVSEDDSSFMQQRPPSITFQATKNTRWGAPRSRETSLQLDGMIDSAPRIDATSKSRPTTAQTATAQSFVLPDLPNLTELVSGVFQDGTPVFSKTAPPRTRFGVPRSNGRGAGRQPAHTPIDSVPIPYEEKAIFTALQLLQDRVAQMENERAEAEKKIEEQELEIIELRVASQTQDRLRRSDGTSGSTDGEGAGKGSWKVEKTRLEATTQTLRTKLDRSERKVAVFNIEKKRLNAERDSMASQLGLAFQSFEEVKAENHALRNENDSLRLENDSLRAENESLRDQLDQEQMQYREETVQLRRQVDQSQNATQKENATLHAELSRVRAQQDEHTQHLARKDMELRKARKDVAEYARLKADNEALKTQMAKLKARREEDNRRWLQQEAAFKDRVERRDETIRHFQDATQEQTNEAMRLDNEHLRQELAELSAQQEEENQRWTRREAELNRKVERRERTAREMEDMTREFLSIRSANSQQVSNPTSVPGGQENIFEDAVSRKSNYRREDNTRTRIRNRVQQEVRNSKVANASQPSSFINETPRNPIKISRPSHRASLPADPSRSVSAPVSNDKDSDTESTTDLSLAPRSKSKSRPSTVEPPAPLDLTELSFIDGDQIAQLRRKLEEERAAMRNNRASSVPLERQAREDTVRSGRQVETHTSHSQQQNQEDTVQSATSARSTRRPSLPRKSSLKDITEKTNATELEDLTGLHNNDNAATEQTQTGQSIADVSLLSNTSRRRRSAPTEMTSAFILPDIKISARKQGAAQTEITQNTVNQDHDNDNCTVCRSKQGGNCDDSLRIPKLVPVSSRMPDDVDATLRPSKSPKESLAFVVKGLQDERAHLHIELAVTRALLENHDVSLGMRKRMEIDSRIRHLLDAIRLKDTHIYNLYDVLEGQDNNDLTEQNVEELAREIRTEEENVTGVMKKGKDKKVTIQSYIDSESEHSGHLSGDDEELPWEGFEETSQSVNLGGLSGVY
ncbi:hypothetical protein K504DRAFT_471203 [Pleomassaria siparia CBS 279.74]|uniref:Cep57 centrosome microtubule-binding domain-containing protein n=1 Tax=Pleomassaria siparia CBS 279.74 TaxID=1314801 RepID=A0A6G1K1T2_9PLEO|nr:hypothetical protein K504DRAFT_471203 [Pleomassaria siparia CBS 279.74]